MPSSQDTENSDIEEVIVEPVISTEEEALDWKPPQNPEAHYGYWRHVRTNKIKNLLIAIVCRS